MAGPDGCYHRVDIGNDIFEVKKRYRNLKPVGGGAYGVVCSADDEQTGRKVAIKKIEDVFADLVDSKRILREIKLLRHFEGHENVIRIVDVATMPPNTKDFNEVYIVTDLMESDLERIITSKQALKNAHYQFFLYQILRGMKYIHTANVLHRDLKPSNLLVNGNCDLAICDFGLARGVESWIHEELTEYVVTRWYRAPELLVDCPVYGNAVDDPVHQLKTIMKTLGSPTEEEMSFIHHEEARKAIDRHQHYPKKTIHQVLPTIDPEAADLLGKMLKFNPDDRITIEEALKHPYLAKLHNPNDEPSCKSSFDFEFEKESLESGEEMTQEQLQELMYDEVQHFQRC